MIESRPVRCSAASNKGEIKHHFVSSACWKLCGILQFLLITGGSGEPARCVSVLHLVGSRYFRACCDSLCIGSLLKRETVVREPRSGVYTDIGDSYECRCTQSILVRRHMEAKGLERRIEWLISLGRMHIGQSNVCCLNVFWVKAEL